MQARVKVLSRMALVLAAAMAVSGCASFNGMLWGGPDGRDGKEVSGKALAADLKKAGIEAEVKFGTGDNVASITTPGGGAAIFAIEDGDYEYVVIKDNDIVAFKKATNTTGCHLRVTNLPNGIRYACVGTCPTGTGCFMGGKSTPDGYYVFCKCK